jgi:hypothetical protein
LNTTCPHCAKPFAIEAHLPAEQRLSFAIKFETGMISARTVHSTLANMDKMLQVIAKDVGYKCHTFVEAVRMKEGELVFDLFICDAKVKPSKGSERKSEAADKTSIGARSNEQEKNGDHKL